MATGRSRDRTMRPRHVIDCQTSSIVQRFDCFRVNFIMRQTLLTVLYLFARVPLRMISQLFIYGIEIETGTRWRYNFNPPVIRREFYGEFFHFRDRRGLCTRTEVVCVCVCVEARR